MSLKLGRFWPIWQIKGQSALNWAWEIIDEILLLSKSHKAAIAFNRFDIMLKFDGSLDAAWAIEHSHLPYLKYLKQCGLLILDWKYRVALQEAALNDHFEIVKYCHANLELVIDDNSIDYAIYNGNMAFVNYLYAFGFKPTKQSGRWAELRGYEDLSNILRD